MTTQPKDKETMQNNIKMLQAKSQNINKLQDKGNRVVVLQLGSHSIKMGFANQRVPFTIRPFVAYKKDKKIIEQQQQIQPYVQKFNYQLFQNQYLNLQQQLKMEGVVNGDKPFKGKPKNKTITSVDMIPRPDFNQPILFGEDALWVQDNPDYIVKKPIQHGFFNIQKQQDFKSQLNDIQNLIYHLMKQKLKIPTQTWNTFSCILIVPDVFVRKHVKQMIKMLFIRIGFKKMYIHLESVMSCFGTAVSSACVIDIGHQKISVCCVDQGVIIPKSLIRKNFGFKDLSKGLIKILSDKLNPDQIDQLQISKQGDLNQIDKIKQIACAIKQSEENTSKIYQIFPVRNGKQLSVHFAYSDSFCVVANSIFSLLWNAFQIEDKKQYFDSNSQIFGLQPDPEDYFEQFSGGGQIYEISKDHPSYSHKMADQFEYDSIDNLIWASLESIKQAQIRKKFASNILVVGGGGHLLKLVQQIMLRLNRRVEDDKQFAEKFQLASDLPIRQIAPIYASWLGGTVIPKLDSLRDLWIERNKFIGSINNAENEEQEQQMIDKKLFTRKELSQEWGIKYLKEKIPFLW